MEYRIWNIGNLIRAVHILFVFILFGCTTELPVSESPISQSLRDSVTPQSERVYEEVSLDGESLNVELANTPKKITLGLSYRDEIGADGMLFEMPQRVVPTFWMKGMLMDLDMVWIDCEASHKPQATRDKLIGAEVVIDSQECIVVDVTRNVPAPAEPLNLQSLPTYSPQFPVTHVLETHSTDTR